MCKCALVQVCTAASMHMHKCTRANPIRRGTHHIEVGYYQPVQGLPEPTAYPIAEVTSEILRGANGEDYIRTTVILEDGHPELDGRALNKFTLHIAPLCTERGFKRPTIVYANRSEIPV